MLSAGGKLNKEQETHGVTGGVIFKCREQKCSHKVDSSSRAQFKTEPANPSNSFLKKVEQAEVRHLDIILVCLIQ